MSAAKFHEWFTASRESGTSIAINRLRTEGARFRNAMGVSR